VTIFPPFKLRLTNGNGSGTTKIMHIIVFHSIKVVMQGVNVFSMNANEVTIMEHQEWIIVHVYVMKH
jgi:hypothetical protein